MTYYDVALLKQDTEFLQRVAACYSTEPGTAEDPDAWANANAWDVASSPGFGDAYASAIAGGIGNPGSNPAVITDAQLLSAVQGLLTTPPEGD